MKKLLWIILALILPALSYAECYPPAAVGVNAPLSQDCVHVGGYLNAAGKAVPNNIGDVCQNENIPKSSKSIVISTATTTELVAAVSGKVIYVCALDFTTGGTAPTYTFKTGTKVSTACDTGPVSLTGTFAPTTGSTFLALGSGTLMQSATSGEICVTTAGTTPAANGFMTYIQQ